MGATITNMRNTLFMRTYKQHKEVLLTLIVWYKEVLRGRLTI